MSRKIWFRYGIVIVISLLIAGVLELLLFNRYAISEKTYSMLVNETNANISRSAESTEIKLTQEEENSILVSRENAKILAELNGEAYQEHADETVIEKEDGMYRKQIQTTFRFQTMQPVFVHELQIFLPNQTTDYEVAVYVQDTDGEQLLQKSQLDKRIQGGIYRADGSWTDWILVFTGEKEIGENDLQLIFRNERSLNPVRVIFFFVFFMLGGLILLYGKWFTQRPEHLFALCSLLLGGLLIYTIGTNQIGYDEHIHMKQAYNLSFGSTVLTTESAMQMEASAYPSFHSYGERLLTEEYGIKNHDFSWANITTQSRFPSYEVRVYLPIAIMLCVGRVLGLPFAAAMMFGKLGGLLAYTVLGWLAVRLAKQGKLLVAALGLLPNFIFAASTFTYDGVLNGCFLLAAVLTMNEFLNRERRLSPACAFLLLASYIAGSLSKPIYILMALILLLLPKEKFDSRMRELLFKSAVVIIAGLMIYSFFFPPVSASSNYEIMGNLAYAGDKRSQGTSVLGQISYILHNPFQYMKLLLGSMATELGSYFTGTKQFLAYGYLGGLPTAWTWITGIALLGGAVFAPEKEHRREIGGRNVIWVLLMVFGMSAVIWTSMYVTFTAVGSQTIQGVQGRYFLPLFLPVLYCLQNRKKRLPISEAVYGKLLLGVLVAANLYGIFFLGLLPRSW